MRETDVVAPMDDAEHAALGLFRKVVEQDRVGAIHPRELAVARGARAALNGRHPLAPSYREYSRIQVDGTSFVPDAARPGRGFVCRGFAAARSLRARRKLNGVGC